MKILVTGSNGFVGRHLMKALESRGHEVFGFDYSVDPAQDVRSFESLYVAVKNVGAEVIFNLAGILGTTELFQEPWNAFEINVRGCINALEVAKQTGAKVVEIGKPNLWKHNVYTITKQAAEDMTLAYGKYQNVDVRMIKWFNIFGDGQHYGWPRKLAPTSIVHALKGWAVPIYGDGSQTADHIYVDDAVNMAIDVLEAGDKGRNKIVEIGTEHDLTINQFVDLVEKYTGKEVKRKFMEMREGEEPNSIVCADLSQYAEVTGKGQTFSIEESLRRTIEWYKENLDSVVEDAMRDPRYLRLQSELLSA